MGMSSMHTPASPVELAARMRESIRHYIKLHPGCTSRTVIQATRIIETLIARDNRSYGTEKYANEAFTTTGGQAMHETYTLLTPITYRGSTVTELTFDFSLLTKKTLQSVGFQKDLAKGGGTESRFAMLMASVAAQCPVGIIEQLQLRDYTHVRKLVEKACPRIWDEVRQEGAGTGYGISFAMIPQQVRDKARKARKKKSR